MALAREYVHTRDSCLREAGTTSQQRAGLPNILLWNMMVVIVFQLVPCNFQKKILLV